jgi:deazaflavin-dependent oxidoreductase (nitroreductase family)
MGEFDFKAKPTGLFKWFLHAPTWIYRARLGFVMGKRFLMIEHRGRKSAKLYRTMLEVAGRNAERNEWIVTSGTGPKADWYRNVEAGGVEAVWLGSKRHRAGVRFLDPTEAAEVMNRYEQQHPNTAAKLMASTGVFYDGTDEGRVEMMKQIPMVAFSFES